ncbi:MAG: helix-turn-helix domain-containing protein [Thermoproteota archaeon]
MTFGGTKKSKSVETILKEAGFTVSQKCSCRPSCFDFAARKLRHLIFVKIQPDTENISPEDYLELNLIAQQVSARPLTICEESHETPLEDDTAYFRHGVLIITQNTFQDVVLHKTYPLIRADPEGYFVNVDGEAIKQRREELGLSLNRLSKLVGVPRKILYRYERGTGKTSVSTAYNIIKALGVPVAEPVEVLKSDVKPSNNLSKVSKSLTAENDLLKEVFQTFSDFNLTTVKKAPFDFLIKIQNRITVIGGVIKLKEEGKSQRVNEILSVSRVVQACPLLITEGEESISEDALCLPSQKLSDINGLEDLILALK